MKLLERHPWANRELQCDEARRILEVHERGTVDVGGVAVDVAALQTAAEGATRLYEPAALERLRAGGVAADRPSRPRVVVTDETTQDTAFRLVDAGRRVVALNFASGRNPGGGFLRGSRTQEEDLCRCSGLFATLLTQPAYYEPHRADRTPWNLDHVIHSPDVPFLRRTSRGAFELPLRRVSVISAVAPVASVLRERGTYDEAAVRRILERRWANVLAVAADRGDRTLILGAWGCGAFGNDPDVAAAAAATAIAGSASQAAFDELVFAIPDRGKVGQRNHEGFRRGLAALAALAGAAGAAGTARGD